ncbi:ubiquinol-cytochrome C chaperone family protein [Rhodopseudomonas sp. RCAM05734]|uniref:ubiquinol-cytochrome C chaperone family protein n=1 Tax=Rhodopseudomonas sp. RCAM05734 TaxID=3457549 RepID=UPI0040441BB7
MLWPFNHFRKPPAPLRGTIEAIYGMIVAQAREPRFYRELGVADTVNGRFDMLLLHLWLLLQQLKEIETSGASQESLSQGLLSQGLIDRFCSDMDHNLRELGTSDLKVPKKMQEFGRAFYGRAAAYDRALAEGPEALALALDKNIYNGTDLAQARRLAGYVAEATAALAALDETTVANGSWRFPPPVATEMMTK